MQPPRIVRRLRARADVRAAAFIGGLLILAIVIQGFALFGFAKVESLEEGDRWVEHALATLRSGTERGLSASDAISGLDEAWVASTPSVRLWSEEKELLATWGEWPAAGRVAPARRGDDSRAISDRGLLEADRFLVGTTRLASGERIELAFPLAHLAAETFALGWRLVVIGIVLAATSLVTAIWATSTAFSPIRRATALLKEVDARQLGNRLPINGSGDPADRHAVTLNRVLSDIDDSFARLRAFGSDLAHELRTPINRIGTMAEVALLADEPVEMSQTLEGIRESAAEVSRIIDSLLLLSEIYGEGFELRPSPVDMDTKILRAAEVYAPLFEEREVELTARSEAGSVQGDGTLIDRVLVNLLDNGLRYVDSGGRVEIGAFRCEGGIVVHFDDSGRGIPAADRDRIFDRFTRLDKARSREGKGLGLALARAIARLHGGDLEVADSPLGGARFILNLPEVSRLGGYREDRQADPTASSPSSVIGAHAAIAGETRSP